MHSMSVRKDFGIFFFNYFGKKFGIPSNRHININIYIAFCTILRNNKHGPRVGYRFGKAIFGRLT
jgi:hypothetical protein